MSTWYTWTLSDVPRRKAEEDGPRRIASTGAWTARLDTGYKRCIAIADEKDRVEDWKCAEGSVGSFNLATLYFCPCISGAARSLGTEPKDPGTQITRSGCALMVH